MGKKQIEVIPYLAFSGDCEEAVGAYTAAFGGEVLYLSRWPEESADVPPEQAGKVMHMEFLLGGTRMAAGDSFDSPAGNTSIRLMIHMERKEDALRAVEILAEGGTVLSPLKPHPKPDDGGCGSVTRDRFGFLWIVTCPNPERS